MAQSSAARITNDVPNFDVAEAVTPVGTAPCAECRGPIADTYYEVDEGVICAACHTRVAASLTKPTSASLARATTFGLIAAALSAAIYFVVSAAASRDVAVTLVVAGFVVGKAVRVGARRQRGLRYQWLAVALTYVAIATTYVPFVMKGFSRGSSAQDSTAVAIPGMEGLVATVPAAAPAAPTQRSLGAAGVDLVELTALAFAAPLLESTTPPLELLVLVGALLLAWRANTRTAIRISGPYRVRVATG